MRKPVAVGICDHCGGSFTPNRVSDLHCSRQCASRASYGAAKADGRTNLKELRTCECGRTFEVRSDKKRTRCMVCLRPSPQRQRRRRNARAKLAVAAAGTTGTGAWTQGHCRRCGVSILSKQPIIYCTQRCKRGDAAGRRRARQNGADVEPGRRWFVFVRDDWTCHICGDLVDRDAEVPALDAPVIDHVVPLAKGGAHCEANWRTAHFYCNSVKADHLDWGQVA